LSIDSQKKAAILGRIIADGVGNVPYRWFDCLPGDLRDLIFHLLRDELDLARRRTRLRMELVKLGDIDLLEEWDRLDLSIDPDSLGSPGYNFITLGETYKPLPPLRWAIKRLFARPSVSIIFGAPKGLKTMLVLEAAICVAAARRWLDDTNGRGGFEVETCPVAWVDLENGPRRMTERIAAYGRGRTLPESTPFTGIRWPLPGWMRPIQKGWDG
jgi:hypothetical protein